MADKLMYIPNDNRIKYFVGVNLFFGGIESEVGKKGRKKKRWLRGNFHLELFVRITFPFPC